MLRNRKIFLDISKDFLIFLHKMLFFEFFFKNQRFDKNNNLCRSCQGTMVFKTNSHGGVNCGGLVFVVCLKPCPEIPMLTI